MQHVDHLLLAGRDAEHDPATELFAQEHLRECAECRELRRKVDRADALIAAPMQAAPVPARTDARTGPGLGRVGIATFGVLLLVVGIVAGTAIRTLRQGDGPSQVAAPGRPASSLPKDWQLLALYDLLIPIPPGWQKTIDALGQPPSPDGPRILYFRSPALAEGAAGELTIWIWPSPSLDRLVEDRYVKSSLSLVSHGIIASWRPVREVIGVAQWSDGRGSGSYKARSLFVQTDPERVVMVGVFGPQTPSTQTEPSPEMRSIQDLVTSHIVALPDTTPDHTADQARAAIDRKLPLVSAPSVDGDPPFFVKSVIWMVKDRAHSTVRISEFPVGTRPRSTLSPSLLSGDSPPGSPTILRVIGNLVVWVTAPDANVRYTVVTALDALLEPATAAASPAPISVSGSRNGTCTTGPLSASAQDGEYVFRGTVIDEGNEFVLMEKRGATIGERLFATLTRLDAQGAIGLPGSAAEPFGSGELVFRLGVYKPAGEGCWRVDVRDMTDSRIVASHVVEVRELAGACPRTRTSDASGVITNDGLTGIAGETIASAKDINAAFVMLRRGSAPGGRVSVVFEPIGRTAPAESVSYEVAATSQHTRWGDVVFLLGVKPIGFENSCWRLIVDGARTGIVLFVGP